MRILTSKQLNGACTRLIKRDWEKLRSKLDVMALMIHKRLDKIGMVEEYTIH